MKEKENENEKNDDGDSGEKEEMVDRREKKEWKKIYDNGNEGQGGFREERKGIRSGKKDKEK